MEGTHILLCQVRVTEQCELTADIAVMINGVASWLIELDGAFWRPLFIRY